MAFLPGEPIAMEIPLLFFFPPGRPRQALPGGMGFRCEDQSRIAAVCREIRRLAALELTLCSNWRQDEFFLFALLANCRGGVNPLLADEKYCEQGEQKEFVLPPV